MAYPITGGKTNTALKVVIYGPEGIGKTTFASHFPDPVFIDTEGSTSHYDLQRFPAPTSWAMLLEEVQQAAGSPACCRTLVIDTADWAEKLCCQSLLARCKKSGIEDFGYGKGYTYLNEDFGKLLNLLNEVVATGIHVVFTAHAAMRKFEQPDEIGAYDRWELKLHKLNSAMLKEWADMVLFANYRTFAVATDDKGKKFKAQGGERVMYTTHHPCWDAKNRYGLEEMLPFSFQSIASLFGAAAPAPENKPETQAYIKDRPVPLEEAREALQQLVDTPAPPAEPQIPEELPAALRDLMRQNRVDEAEIRRVVAERGYFPEDMPVASYPMDFVQGVLISAWDQVFGMILQSRNEMSADDLPF